MFYEIPVARPWTDRSPSTGRTRTSSSRRSSARRSASTRSGPSSTTSSRSTRTAPTPRCSTAPSPLRPATCASATASGSLPKPYNHPVRSAESAAVLDLISDGRVEFGTGRSSTRAELEGFGIHPTETREMWQEALDHIVGCWTNDEYEFSGKHWSMPRRRVLPKPFQKPHPPIWGATGSPETHRLVGQMGLGLLSFSVGTPPEELKRRIDIYRQGISECTKPSGKFINDQAASFTLVNCRADPRGVAGGRARNPSSGTRSTGPGSSGRSPSGSGRSRRSSAPTSTWRSTADRVADGSLDAADDGLPGRLQGGRGRQPRSTSSRRSRPTRRPAATWCSACSTPTTSPTTRSCRPSS